MGSSITDGPNVLPPVSDSVRVGGWLFTYIIRVKADEGTPVSSVTAPSRMLTLRLPVSASGHSVR